MLELTGVSEGPDVLTVYRRSDHTRTKTAQKRPVCTAIDTVVIHKLYGACPQRNSVATEMELDWTSNGLQSRSQPLLLTNTAAALEAVYSIS